MTTGIGHRSTQREVAGAAACADQQVANSTDGPACGLRRQAACRSDHDQVACAGQIALGGIDLGRARHCAVGQDPVNADCRRLTNAQGRGLCQVQPAVAGAGADAGDFGFQRVAALAYASACPVGVQAQLLGVNVNSGVGVVQNAAAGADDAD